MSTVSVINSCPTTIRSI